jgi:ferredoxin
MIVAELKPIKEIAASLAAFKKVLVVGCDSCVTVCLTGGEKETNALAAELAHIRYYAKKPPTFETRTIQRQCERDLIESYLEVPSKTDAILSLACGAGIQTLAAYFTTIPVIPAVNTTFLGALDGPGVWREKCQGCGDCILVHTGGVCPVSRCAKSLLNGPCGGSSNGKCEINKDIDCAWQLILDRLKALGRLDCYEKIMPMKDWSTDRAGGLRTLNRTIDPES